MEIGNIMLRVSMQRSTEILEPSAFMIKFRFALRKRHFNWVLTHALPKISSCVIISLISDSEITSFWTPPTHNINLTFIVVIWVWMAPLTSPSIIFLLFTGLFLMKVASNDSFVQDDILDDMHVLRTENRHKRKS